MEWLLQLVSNKILIGSLSAWVVAQVLKTILYAAINKTFDIKRLFGDGGMPSGHSATVSSLATVCCLIHGADSFQFAMSGILAVIVCHDATGVRRETGKQAVLITEIIQSVMRHYNGVALILGKGHSTVVAICYTLDLLRTSFIYVSGIEGNNRPFSESCTIIMIHNRTT